MEYTTCTAVSTETASAASASNKISDSVNGSDMSRCSPSPSPSPPLSKARSQSPSPRLLTSRSWQAAGPSSRLCRSNPLIRQSLSPSPESGASGPCLRLTKDPVQPATGSLSDIRRHQNHETTNEEDEEETDETFDNFPDVPRPRAFTCPVSRAFNRKLRSRILNRPPTPTYKDTASSQGTNFDFQFLDPKEKTTTTTMEMTTCSSSSSISSCEMRMCNGLSELEAIMETL